MVSFLVAVYLCCRIPKLEFKTDIRKRAYQSDTLFVCVGGICLLLTSYYAPQVHLHLSNLFLSVLWLLGSGLLLAACFNTLHHQHWLWSRRFGVAIAIVMTAGLAFFHFPFMIYSEITVTASAAPRPTLKLTLMTLAAGSVLLIPSFLLLYRIFDTIAQNPSQQDKI